MMTLVYPTSVQSTTFEFSGPRITCHPALRPVKLMMAASVGSDMMSSLAVKGPREMERQREFNHAAITRPGSLGFGP